MKKLKLFVASVLTMFVCIITVNADFVGHNLEWREGDDHTFGYATKVSDIVTRLKGADEKDDDVNGYVGPYTYNITGALADGFTEEITVDIKLEDMLNPEDAKIKESKGAQQGFYVTSVLFYDDGYKTEARLTTANENSKVYFYLDWDNSDKKYEITEDGLYTYKWHWYTKDSKIYVVAFFEKDDEILYESDPIDMTKKASGSDTVTEEEIAKYSAGYVWFYAINLENGIDVYSKIPETVAEPEVTGDAITTDSETYDVLQHTLLNTSDEKLQELMAKNDVTVALEAKEITAIDKLKKEFTDALPNATISKYLDISVLVKAGETTLNLHELDEEITLTVKIPEDLPEVAEGYTRVYYILREHDGKVETLETVLSEDGTELSFATDKFSTYAVAYEDQANSETTPENPNTLDNIGNYLMISAIACTGLVALGYSIKKKFEN